MLLCIESYMLKQIEAMLNQDKKQIDGMVSTDKEIFSFKRDPESITRLYLEYSTEGLNFFLRGTLLAGIKFKIKQIDRCAKINVIKK